MELNRYIVLKMRTSYFSTEIRPINLINNLQINQKSILNYLKFGELCVGNTTLFKNVYNHDTSTITFIQ